MNRSSRMSEATKPAPALVVGTAGHIDHGKTSLVRALTGIDTDTQPEEKRRGISIDLGFAHLSLGDGRVASLVDVPGHERFIRNMAAGAAGMQAVMLIVAATEGVMPQTREHLQICRLLGVETGFVVLTKTDLASREQIEAARAQVAELVSGTFLENAPTILVSAVTRQGIDAVLRELRGLRVGDGNAREGYIPRLWVDRSFVKSGFGTVVTGTLSTGKLQPGNDTVMFPKRKQVRIRSMQIHGRPVDAAFAGQRAAINLTGMDASAIERGHVLSVASNVRDNFVFDAWVEWLHAGDVPAVRTNYGLHLGSAECTASVKVIHSVSDHRALVRVWTSAPLLTIPRDRFILRRLSPALTVAGGEVLEIAPPVRLTRARTVRRLQALSGADDGSRVETLVAESAAGRTLVELERSTGLTPARVRELVLGNPHLLLCEAQRTVVTKAWLGERRDRLTKFLTEFHQQNPSLPGAPIAQARIGLKPELAEVVLERNPNVKISGDTVALATHKPLFSKHETAEIERVEMAFRAAAFQPPAPNEVLAAATRNAQNGRRILDVLIKNKRLIRVAEDVIFHADVIAHIRKSLAAHRGRRFTVPEFKDWTQMSRKFAIPVLEYLDREHVTRREGDTRIVL